MKLSVLRTSLWAGAAVLLGACSSAPTVETADTIYSGGSIITINDAQPQVQAVAVKAGKILAAGTKADIEAQYKGRSTNMVDLAGRTMLPGFFDSHGHAYMIGIQASTANLLPAPDGTGNDIASLQSLLSRWAEQNQQAVEKIGWIAGFGYDDSQLKEQRHPTRDDLDKVSTEYPVLIIHQSGHLGVANSKALELAGVTSATPNPKGGVFRRRAGSQEPNGVLEEYAFFYLVSKLAEQFDADVNQLLVEKGAKLLASYGYTTGQEGRAMQAGLDAIQRTADAGKLPIDIVAYPDILEVAQPKPSLQYRNNFRVGGVKLTIDGSPQGKTAWLTEPYYVPPEGQTADYKGYSAISGTVAMDAVDKAFANNWQILIHGNGDAASDLFIAAVTAAKQKYPNVDNRPVLIHGQVLRPEQIDELQQLAIFPSVFPMHTFYWGDWHRSSVLGPDRAENISPTGWLMQRNMMFGTHHDAPVALPDSMRVLSATVTRTTRSGRVLGPQHRVPVATALKAMTIWPAWQHFEEQRKGSIEVGKQADFVILSDNPLTVAPEQLVNIKVLQTIKEDRSVYQRAQTDTALVTPAMFGNFAKPHADTDELEGVHSAQGDGHLNPALSVLVEAFSKAGTKPH